MDCINVKDLKTFWHVPSIFFHFQFLFTVAFLLHILSRHFVNWTLSQCHLLIATTNFKLRDNLFNNIKMEWIENHSFGRNALIYDESSQLSTKWIEKKTKLLNFSKVMILIQFRWKHVISMGTCNFEGGYVQTNE